MSVFAVGDNKSNDGNTAPSHRKDELNARCLGREQPEASPSVAAQKQQAGSALSLAKSSTNVSLNSQLYGQINGNIS